MALNINLEVSDRATPALHALQGKLTDRSELNAYLASTAEAGTRQYLREAAKTRHTTAERLGAGPTNYLTKRADLTESKHTADAAIITVHGAIFQRVFGAVTVKPKPGGKYLTIPGVAAAYGKSAREFNDLGVKILGKKNGELIMGLVKAEQSALGTRRRAGFNYENRAPLLTAGKADVYFWLKKSVVLPQDRGLLPSDLAFAQMAERAARAYLKKVARDLGV